MLVLLGNKYPKTTMKSKVKNTKELERTKFYFI